jgi:hypothetical protein
MGIAAGTLPLVLAGLGLLVIIVAFVIANRQRKRQVQQPPTVPDTAAPGQAAPAQAGPARTGAGEPATSQTGAWTAPQQPAPAPPKSGPGLAASIMLIRAEANGLEISWNALVDGSVPVAVHWGAPALSLNGDVLELRYVYDPATMDGKPFQAPRTRVFRPGELISRAVSVPWPQIGRSPAGLKVLVNVGYGSADDLAGAAADAESYLAWQRIAAARPRPVPAAG